MIVEKKLELLTLPSEVERVGDGVHVVMVETLLEPHQQRLVVREPDGLRLEHAAELRERTIARRPSAARVDVDRHRHLRHLVVDAVDVNGERGSQPLGEADGIGRRLEIFQVVCADRDVLDSRRHEGQRVSAAVRIRIRRVRDHRIQLPEGLDLR